ncbi:HNH endonuclease [Nissabacter archeti]|uniref:HNH endonuclease n=1 Tax=Nissabacter archeti TaxID=1917880 RepID=UPI000933AB67|nr:HNH endonuclease [Nissabacter archeti]
MFKVERSYPAPESLARRTKYDSEDVHLALQECFYRKCYICETKDPLDINVEHFTPRTTDESKIFDWDNLYLSCARCNNIKLIKYDNILDCCKESVWENIKLLPGFSVKTKTLTVIPLMNDAKTLLTAELLNRVYNSDHTISKKLTSASLRAQVTKATQILTRNMIEYYQEDTPEQTKTELIEKMKVLISKKSQYSAFCRWVIREDDELSKILEPFMD